MCDLCVDVRVCWCKGFCNMLYPVSLRIMWKVKDTWSPEKGFESHRLRSDTGTNSA